MKKEAILHIPQSQFAYAVDEYSLIVRLRVAKNDVKICNLYYGDRCYPSEPIKTLKLEMELAGSDGMFDYYEARIADHYTRVCYFFEISDIDETLYYCERGLVPTLDCSRTEYFQFPFIRREEIISPPEWLINAVIYHIFPDSFADGKRSIKGLPKDMTVTLENDKTIRSRSNLGGTLSGVKDNVDYLADLGITCIYLNPIFVANSYHKYDTANYFEIDPCFGSLEDIKALINTCHENGIKVIFDGVYNHCGPDFFAFADVVEKGKDSEYFDWFYDMPDKVEYKDPPNYAAFAYVKEMPKLNTSNPKVLEYFLKVGRFWIEEVGIDGWRLDVANEIDHDFWRAYRRAIKQSKFDAIMIGEIWEDAPMWLVGDQFDSTMNYRFTYLCREFFGNQAMSVSDFDNSMIKMIYRYPHRVSLAQMNMLDSHDVPRFISYCQGDRRRMELAFFYLFMGYGVPSVFYGDENYIEGTEETGYRQAMTWGASENCFDKFKEWIEIRKSHRAIQSGSYKSLFVDDDNRVYAFARVLDRERVLIVINNSEREYKVSDELKELVRGYIGKEFEVEKLSPYGYQIFEK